MKKEGETQEGITEKMLTSLSNIAEENGDGTKRHVLLSCRLKRQLSQTNHQSLQGHQLNHTPGFLENTCGATSAILFQACRAAACPL